ncbi:MAG: cyclic nucleotide-binding domain-containing protein [Leptospira sp.]|nr:cyclic nucleotide-binding domain-containing protein [Leptospira sp.]NCS95573.1 cyclic nucleotide-binding domain-containing protein [Leptospira sp.]
MIHPKSKLRALWDGIILLLVVYIAIEYPLRYILNYTPTKILKIMNILTTVFFCLDILIQFRTSYIDRGVIISNPKLVARKYLKTWFFIDFISGVPFELLLNYTGMYGQLLKILRLIRLGRLLKLFKMNTILMRRARIYNVQPGIMRLLIFLLWISLFAHWIALGWLHLGGVSDSISFSHQYLRSMYWTVTTLTTIGYGEIVPVTSEQTIFTILVMLTGVGVYGYVIGNIANLMSNLDIVHASHVKRMEKVNAFIKYRRLPRNLRNRILDYYDYLFERKIGSDESDFYNDLPKSLVRDIKLYLNKDLIAKIPFFKNASDALLTELVLSLKPVIYLPGDYVMRIGEIGHNLYFINKGHVQVISPDHGGVLATLSEGSFFGEQALLSDEPRNASIKTNDFCELFTLEKKKFQDVIKKFPAFAREMELERILRDKTHKL